MKRFILVLLILTLISTLSVPSLAIAADKDVILRASQELINCSDRYEGIDGFISALDQLNGLTLQIGSRGSYVAAFQSLLIAHDYLPRGEDDGISHDKNSYRCQIARGIMDYLFTLIQNADDETMKVLYRWADD